MNPRYLFYVLIATLAMSLASATEMPIVWARNTTEVACVNGGGTWTTLSKDAPGGICQCALQGDIPIQKWTGSACVAWTPEEACIYSFGQWAGTTCICDTVRGIYEWSDNPPLCVGIGGVAQGGTTPGTSTTQSSSWIWVLAIGAAAFFVVRNKGKSARRRR